MLLRFQVPVSSAHLTLAACIARLIFKLPEPALANTKSDSLCP